MTELSAAHRQALARILDACDDAALGRLERAVGALPGARAAGFTAMIRDEGRDRRRRRLALAPVLPLFGPRRDGVPGLGFPPALLGPIWRAAAATEQPDLLARLDDEDDDLPALGDRLCLLAAGAIRGGGGGIAEAAAGGDLEYLACCFDLASTVRRGLSSLAAWTDRPNGEQAAELRVMVRDAAEQSPDGAIRLIEIFFAHLDDAARILRILVQTSGAAGHEAFLSESEMGVFVERLVDAMEARAARLSAFQPSDGAEALAAVSADLAWCAGALGEIDLTLQLRPDSRWGRRIRALRDSVAARLERRLNEAERAVDEVLPMERVQTIGRMTRELPAFDAPEDRAAVDRARTLMSLVAAVRRPAAIFACEAARTRLLATLEERLMTYADSALELINAGLAPDEDRALTRVELAADFLARIERADAARAVRRRVAAAASALPHPLPLAGTASSAA